MTKSPKFLFVHGFSLILILLLHQTSILAQELDDESEFSYIERSEKGPKNWGDIKKEWATCKNGGMQSPIDLSSKKVKINPRLDQLKTSYKPCNATLKNRGHDIQVQWLGDAGTMEMNGVTYALKQCHWHSPSEHTVHGKRYDLELHMVHTSINPDVNNSIAVIGIFYNIGHPDEFLSLMEKNIMAISDKKREKRIQEIDPNSIGMNVDTYFSYTGSLTTPPCTEGVIWIIREQVMTVAKEQVNLLRAAVSDYATMNARPIQ